MNFTKKRHQCRVFEAEEILNWDWHHSVEKSLEMEKIWKNKVTHRMKGSLFNKAHFLVFGSPQKQVSYLSFALKKPKQKNTKRRRRRRRRCGAFEADLCLSAVGLAFISG